MSALPPKADIRPRRLDVCFTPESGHSLQQSECPFLGHKQTSSAYRRVVGDAAARSDPAARTASSGQRRNRPADLTAHISLNEAQIVAYRITLDRPGAAQTAVSHPIIHRGWLRDRWFIALNQPNHSPQCRLNIRTQSVRTARHVGELNDHAEKADDGHCAACGRRFISSGTERPHD